MKQEGCGWTDREEEEDPGMILLAPPPNNFSWKLWAKELHVVEVLHGRQLQRVWVVARVDYPPCGNSEPTI